MTRNCDVERGAVSRLVGLPLGVAPAPPIGSPGPCAPAVLGAPIGPLCHCGHPAVRGGLCEAHHDEFLNLRDELSRGDLDDED